MKRREFMKSAAIGAGAVTTLHMCDMLAAREAEAFPSSGGVGIQEAMYRINRGKEKNLIPEIRS